MPSPALLFDEAAALDALREFVRTAVPEVPEVDVYRWRPAAVTSKWGLQVLLAPVNPMPIFADSYSGEESTGKQRQRIRVTITTAAVGAWALRVLSTAAPHTANPGATTADIRTGLQGAVNGLGLAVATEAAPAPAGQAAFDILGDDAGASLGVRFTSIPIGGATTIAVIDDSLRRAVYNWGTWTIRVIVRDIPAAGGTRPSMVGAYVERLRLYMQGSSIPVVNGLAYPFVRDRLQGTPAKRLAWRKTLGPFEASVTENGVWSRGAALDFVFDVPSALLHDIPSLDTVSGTFGAIGDP
jgi:hypothetical protein